MARLIVKHRINNEIGFWLDSYNLINMKKIAIIGTAGVPAKYGGFETLVHHLVPNMSKNYSVSVYCSSKYYKKQNRPVYWKGARLYYIPLNANGSSSIIYDILSMIHAIFYADVLLILGVSGGIFIPFIRLFTNKKNCCKYRWTGMA